MINSQIKIHSFWKINLNNKPNNQEIIQKSAEKQQAHSDEKLVQSQSSEELLHELKAYQLELEMQIEELRRSHIAMEESRDRYLDLFEFAPVGYITISKDGIVSEINLTASKLFGIDRTKLSIRRFINLIAQQDRDRWSRLFMIMKQQTIFENRKFDLVMLRADGSDFYVHLNCERTMYTDEKGNQTVLRIALVDISELKAAEATRIAATVFQSQEGMMITDADGLIIRVNTAFTKITGYSQEDVQGKNPNILRSGRHDTAF